MPPRHHVLIVDADTAHTQLLCQALQGHGLELHVAHDGASLRRGLAARLMDLVVLDRHLPGDDALALTASLRGVVPVVLIGAGSQAIDRVIGLEMGADDFLAKPCEPRELVARIHAVLRRVAAAPAPAAPVLAEEVLHFDGWALDRGQRRLSAPDGRAVQLPEAEFRLLNSFLQSPRRVCSRAELASLARDRTLADCERSIDLLVSRLRSKLADDPRAPRLIKTVRGAGYLFAVQPRAAASPH